MNKILLFLLYSSFALAQNDLALAEKFQLELNKSYADSLKSPLTKEDFNFTSEAFKNHQKHPTGFETINEYMARDFPVPTSMEKYNYVSQLLQAHGMKTAIEAHRIAKPYCMGCHWRH